VAQLILFTPPVVLAQPSNVSVRIFGNTFLSVTVTSTTPVSFTWRKGGVPVPGGDSSLLVFNHIYFDEAGSYDVIATTPAGSVTSTLATVTIDTNRPVGTVVNLDGPLVPLGLTNVIGISAGGYLDAAFLADGSVRVWSDRIGYLLYGNSVAPGMTNIVSVAAGSVGLAYALTESGDVLQWSDGNATGMNNMRMISAYGTSLARLTRDGVFTAFVFGPLSNAVSFALNAGGGVTLRRNGTVVDFSGFSPQVVDSNVVALNSQMRLKSDGTLIGTLGGLTNVAAISDECCLALLHDGTVVKASGERPITGAFAISSVAGHSLVLTTNPPAPVVTAYAKPGGVTVGAPISVSGYALESATNIAGPYTSVVLAATNNLPVFFNDGTARFYRMRLVP
jgi:hypothetical protein